MILDFTHYIQPEFCRAKYYTDEYAYLYIYKFCPTNIRLKNYTYPTKSNLCFDKRQFLDLFYNISMCELYQKRPKSLENKINRKNT